MASPDFEPFFEEEFVGILQQLFGDTGSIRGIARATGIPYSTLQAIVSGETTTPSPRTMARLEQYYESTPITRTMRLKTVVDDSPMWTASKLANLRPPSSANAFQVVGRTGAAGGDTARSGYVDLESMSPFEYVAEREIDPRSISRIVWARRGGFVRGW